MTVASLDMEPAIGALQFVWIAGHRRHFSSHEDYFVELVERLTAVTPDIDRHVARVIRRYRRDSTKPTTASDATGERHRRR